MPQILFIILSLVLASIVFIDDYIITQKSKNKMKDIMTDFWYRVSSLKTEVLVNGIFNKKIRYIFYYFAFYTVLYFIHPPTDNTVPNLIIWFLLGTSALFIRRFVENSIVILLMDFKYYFNRLKIGLSFVIMLFTGLYKKNKLLGIIFPLYVLFLFFALIFLSNFIVIFVSKSGYSVYFYDYLFLLLKSEGIAIVLHITYFVLIILIGSIIIPMIRFTEYMLLKICESKRSVIYSISLILAIIGALLELFTEL